MGKRLTTKRAEPRASCRKQVWGPGKEKFKTRQGRANQMTQEMGETAEKGAETIKGTQF